MPKIARQSVPVIALVALAACSFQWDSEAEAQKAGVAGTGSGNARTFAVADFDGVELRGSDDVDVHVGGAFCVRAEGDSAMLDRLRIARDGAVLKVGRQNGSKWGWGKGQKVRVFVTMPRIASASVAGSGNLAVDRAQGTRFAGSIAGSGNLAVAGMQVDAAELSIAGSGNVTAAGTAKRLTADIAGSGDIDAAALRAQGGKVSVAGSGNVRAAVQGDAQVNVMGSGDIDLGPAARCVVRKMGSGTVRCGTQR
ncbi:MAG TPA: head GIN domain-containing protein [Sphingomonas sp.]|jgi:hypothetical protein|nr:head GIN domain-containing protein [Sphingomonas sp.]